MNSSSQPLRPISATSNAPTIGRKRRLSTPGEDDEGESSAKRAKGEDGTASPAAHDESPAQHGPEAKEETEEEVKEVTQGVEDVELQDGIPEAVPLPASPPPEDSEEEDATIDRTADDNDIMAISPTKSIKSTSAKGVNGSPASVRSAGQPLAVDPSAPDTMVSMKAPRKVRKLPTKSAEPISKTTKKMEKTTETNAKALAGEVVELKQDSGSA